ncbi:MAG: hypothetical protein J0M12_10685 [Deltaproteobacteria bacterium]|nr:hypothetical protein [Deltaproteobacteria bacterium]
MSRCTFFLAGICGSLMLSTSIAFGIEPAVGTIIDARTNGKVQGRLEIELKVTGEEVSEVEGLRANVISAIDETGRDLTDVLRVDKQSHFVNVAGPEKTVRLFLKSPSRRASVLKELVGRLDLFMPDNDPEATLVISDFSEKTGKPLESATLKNSGIELTFYNKQQYEQLIKSQPTRPAAGGLVSISNLDDNSLILKLNDPESRIVELEFQTESGERIRPRGTTGAGNVQAFFFPQALPSKARLKIEVATLKSVVRVPFSFENVLLP